MPVCSYVVVPGPGESTRVSEELALMNGCEVAPAENADLLLLVTTTDSLDDDAALRRRVEALPGIQALLLTFGEVDPDGAPARPGGKRLPTINGSPNEAGPTP